MLGFHKPKWTFDRQLQSLPHLLHQAAGVVHSFLHGSVGNLDDEQKMADMATMVPHGSHGCFWFPENRWEVAYNLLEGNM